MGGELSLILLVLAAIGFVGTGVVFLMNRRNLGSGLNLEALMPSRAPVMENTRLRESVERDQEGEEIERLNAELRAKVAGVSKKETLEETMFKAGMFSESQRKDFKRLQLLAPVVLGLTLGCLFGWMGGLALFFFGVVVGVFFGLWIPFRVLSRRINTRMEDISFYLPLVIEQIAIGVSSSLDIGPCIQTVIEMAEDRDTHNPVTELFRYALRHVKSGAPLEEALIETAELAGHFDLKQAMRSICQASKFGGEITKQLQELASAVASQREVKVEMRIKQLELIATGPVMFMFFSYIVLILAICGLAVMNGFSKAVGGGVT
jgi:pilus assembly protein TadC